MGLAIEVGTLAVNQELDEDAVDWLLENMRSLNRYLEQLGLKPHHEPDVCSPWETDGCGYSGLPALRRFAAHLDVRGAMPEPGESGANDEVLQAYYDSFDAHPAPIRKTLFRRKRNQRNFDHLIVHSDAEGYYLPQDFEQVVVTPVELEIPGCMVGSSHRLLEETRVLAQALELPLDLDIQSEEVWAAFDTPGEGDTKWQQYGKESFTCLALHQAAAHSIEHSAAIVFC